MFEQGNQNEDLEEVVATAAALPDETLVSAFVGLMAGFDDTEMLGAATPQGRDTMRVLFMEIAARWLPLEAVARAFEWVTAEGDPPPLPGVTPRLRVVES
jgi:hypothetical protein